MTPDATAITAFLAQLGTAGVFVVAWFRAENQREKERTRMEERLDFSQKQLIDTQTQHRKEMLQLIRDITFGKQARDLADRSEDLS